MAFDANQIEKLLDDVIEIGHPIVQIDKQFVTIVCHKWQIQRHESSAAYTFSLCVGYIDYKHGEFPNVPFGSHGIRYEHIDGSIHKIDIDYEYFAVAMHDQWLETAKYQDIVQHVSNCLKTHIKDVRESRAFKVLYGKVSDV